MNFKVVSFSCEVPCEIRLLGDFEKEEYVDIRFLLK